jgi:hypothetical protein
MGFVFDRCIQEHAIGDIDRQSGILMCFCTRSDFDDRDPQKGLIDDITLQVGYFDAISDTDKIASGTVKIADNVQNEFLCRNNSKRTNTSSGI